MRVCLLINVISQFVPYNHPTQARVTAVTTLKGLNSRMDEEKAKKKRQNGITNKQKFQFIFYFYNVPCGVTLMRRRIFAGESVDDAEQKIGSKKNNKKFNILPMAVVIKYRLHRCYRHLYSVWSQCRRRGLVFYSLT